MQLPSTISPPGNRMNNTMPRLTIPPPRPIYSPDPTPSLPGYYVSNEDDIVLQDVKMDGSISFFPSKDLSRIYIRQWNKRGDLEGLTYVLQQPDIPKPQDPLLVPKPIEQPKQPDQSELLLQTLTSLNNGLAASFQQFGAVLQDMQRSTQEMHQMMSEKLDRFPDGGMG